MSHCFEERVAKSREVGPTKSGTHLAVGPFWCGPISVFGIFWIVGLAKRARQHALEVFPVLASIPHIQHILVSDSAAHVV